MDKSSQRELFLAHSAVQDWQSGDMIRIWTPDTGIYYILDGTVHIMRVFPDGSHSLLHILEKDASFFETRYFHHGTRTTVAYAASRARTAYLSPENVQRLLATSLEFCHFLLRNMSWKNFSIGRSLAGKDRKSTGLRLLAVLHELSCGQDGRSPVVRITQATLADFVGKHPVTTHISLKRLERAGFVRLKRGAVELDLERVEAALGTQES